MAVSTLSRRPEAWLRIAAVAAGCALLVVSISLGATLYRAALLPLFAAALAQSAAVPVALLRPMLAAAISVVAAPAIMLSTHLGGHAPWPWAVTTIVTQSLVLAILGYRARWWLGAITLLTSVVFSGVIAMVVEPSHEQQSVAVNLVIFISAAGVALAGGVLLREWEGIRSLLASERRLTEDERTRRMLAEEKTLIARELHDVIAHSMSIISVQASSAPFRHPQADEALREEFEDIAASSRRALAELRSLLGVLRDPDSPVARTPQPRLSGIPDLVTQSESSGLHIRLSGAETLVDDGVSDVSGLTAYRIVQEALSNVIRHARGAQVEVTVDRADELEIIVLNHRGAGPETTLAIGQGSGLLGMRERAASVGGTVVFGPTADGGYEVHARLPLVPEPTEQLR